MYTIPYRKPWSPDGTLNKIHVVLPLPFKFSKSPYGLCEGRKIFKKQIYKYLKNHNYGDTFEIILPEGYNYEPSIVEGIMEEATKIEANMVMSGKFRIISDDPNVQLGLQEWKPYHFKTEYLDLLRKFPTSLRKLDRI